MEPIAKPFSKDVPAGVTIKSVLDNYLIDWRKSGESRKTIAMVGSTVIPQAPSPLTFTSKADAKEIKCRDSNGNYEHDEQVSMKLVHMCYSKGNKRI
jgi:hypothetical protein